MYINICIIMYIYYISLYIIIQTDWENSRQWTRPRARGAPRAPGRRQRASAATRASELAWRCKRYQLGVGIDVPLCFTSPNKNDQYFISNRYDW